MDIGAMLKKKNIPFETTSHRPTFTAQELAAAEHVSGDHVAKVVIISAGGDRAMLVLPASYQVRMEKVKQAIGKSDCRLATEQELSENFPDCELGAMPPFGREYGMEVYADRHLADSGELLFESGHHDEAIRMKWADYERLEQPRIVDFAEHLH